MAGKTVEEMAAAMAGVTPTAKKNGPSAPSRAPAPAARAEKAELPAERTQALTQDTAAPAEKDLATSGGLVAVGRKEIVSRAGAAGSKRRGADAPPPPPKSGDLVAARVQPSEVGAWTNDLMEQVEYIFGTTKGAALGALLMVARNHWEEYTDLVTAWLGEPDDAIKAMVWAAVRKNEEDRAAAEAVFEADVD